MMFDLLAAATTQAVQSHSLFSVEAGVALIALTLMEIVLGIDNIVFISILVSRLPEHQQKRARQLGLGLAMVMRILLLLSITWVMTLTKSLFNINAFWTSTSDDQFGVSGKDLVLILGGLFLLWKATHEIHNKLEGQAQSTGSIVVHSFGYTILQILMIDLVFSLDSVITAVGMAQHIEIMITAVVISVGVMVVASGYIADVIHRHPTLQMLALSFLIMIGVMLVVEGFHGHIPKGYIYFAMAFSVLVEMLNLRAKSKRAAPQKA